MNSVSTGYDDENNEKPKKNKKDKKRKSSSVNFSEPVKTGGVSFVGDDDRTGGDDIDDVDESFVNDGRDASSSKKKKKKKKSL